MDLQERFKGQSVLLYLKRYRIHLLRFLMGASFAVSLFLFEAGASDLLLARDDSCRAMVRQRRLLGDPERECLPRLARDVLTALNEGFFILVEQNANRVSHWGIMAGIYALVGGLAAQIKGRGGIIAFAIVHLLFLAIQTFLAYVSVYIVGIK